MERTPNSRPRATMFRYTPGTLLFLVLCCAGYLAGYRQGFDTSREERRLATITTESYKVGKLVNPLPGSGTDTPDYDRLINLITTTVHPDEWHDIHNQIVPFPSANSISVTQTGATHKKIRDLLDKLRALRAQFDKRVRSGLCGQCGGNTTSDLPPKCQRCGFTNPASLN